jgi:bifunctional UDP-N-acetylglucosamine pyrophosphorylase/glucosamine-1-phosphate N-acetyltransferase
MTTANKVAKTAVVILAAGKGTRMRSALPKVLHPLAGRPMINYVADTVAALSPERIVVVVGPNMEAVAEAVAPAETIVQTPQLGTGHAVMAVRETLAGFGGDVLILYGDTPLFRPATLEALLAARRAAPEPALVVLGFRPSDPAEYGRLKQAEDGALEAIVEFRDATPEERAIGLCNAGVMVVDGDLLFDLLEGLDSDNAKGEYYLTPARRRHGGGRHPDRSGHRLPLPRHPLRPRLHRRPQRGLWHRRERGR